MSNVLFFCSDRVKACASIWLGEVSLISVKLSSFFMSVRSPPAEVGEFGRSFRKVV